MVSPPWHNYRYHQNRSSSQANLTSDYCKIIFVQRQITLTNKSNHLNGKMIYCWAMRLKLWLRGEVPSDTDQKADGGMTGGLKWQAEFSNLFSNLFRNISKKPLDYAYPGTLLINDFYWPGIWIFVWNYAYGLEIGLETNFDQIKRG